MSIDCIIVLNNFINKFDYIDNNNINEFIIDYLCSDYIKIPISIVNNL